MSVIFDFLLVSELGVLGWGLSFYKVDYEPAHFQFESGMFLLKILADS